MALDIRRAADGNEALQDVLSSVSSQLTTLQAAVATPGIDPVPYGFLVKGEDGNFILEVVDPDNKSFASVQQRNLWASAAIGIANSNAGVQHQLQSSYTRDFDADGSVKTYGPEAKVRWEISDTPDESRYWRIRTTFDAGKTYSRWAEYQDPIICGVIPVWSGQVRSTRQMPNAQLNVTNFATVTSVDAGGTATIKVHGAGGPGTMWYRQVGSITEGPFPSAELTGYVLATKYYVFYDKPQDVFRVFTEAEYSQTLDDRYRFAGYLLTVSAGGAGGTTGGGGTGGPKGCVEVGTPVEFSSGDTVEEIVAPCSEWVILELDNWDEVAMHPDTMVKVWKPAKELTAGDRIGIGDGDWTSRWSTRFERRDGQKVIRKCNPSQEYKAGAARVNLHNQKPLYDPL